MIGTLRALALKINSSEVFNSFFDEKLTVDFEASILSMQQEMNKRHPLSYAQEIMGKNFWTISDYDEYEFIPVVSFQNGLQIQTNIYNLNLCI
ncbi:MAG: hypothetical protein JEZ08_24455 [Clostridiales bacterium]|nr:hypothetical protein [Clostridiales bacterium]